MTFVPEYGIPNTCYPYCGLRDKDDYVSPFVMVTFNNVQQYTGKKDSSTDTNSCVLVECIAWMPSVEPHDYDQRFDMIGSTFFAFKRMDGAGK